MEERVALPRPADGDTRERGQLGLGTHDICSRRRSKGQATYASRISAQRARCSLHRDVRST